MVPTSKGKIDYVKCDKSAIQILDNLDKIDNVKCEKKSAIIANLSENWLLATRRRKFEQDT